MSGQGINPSEIEKTKMFKKYIKGQRVGASLYIAHQSLNRALSMKEPYCSSQASILRTLLTEIIVEYSCCFNSGDGPILNFKEVFNDESLRSKHLRIMELRNKVIGHNLDHPSRNPSYEWVFSEGELRIKCIFKEMIPVPELEDLKLLIPITKRYYAQKMKKQENKLTEEFGIIFEG